MTKINFRTNVEFEEEQIEQIEQRKLEIEKILNVSVTNKDYVRYLILNDISKAKKCNNLCKSKVQ